MSKEIALQQIRIKDPFWSGMQEKITDTVIPFQERVLNDKEEGVEKSHALDNFRIAAGLMEGEFYGMVFQDSDVAKWLEGVAYSLVIKPDAALEQRADDIIDIIAKAQQPDGYADLMGKLDALTTQIQQSAILNSAQPREESADDILANIIDPPEFHPTK